MSVAAANYAIRGCKLQDVAAKMVLTALAWKAPAKTPHLVFMDNGQLRQETGLKSINGVKDALRRLIAAGEVRVIEVGRRGQSTNYELVEVRRLIESGEVSASDISNGDSKPSESDANCQMATVNCQHLIPIDNKTLKTEDVVAIAPAPVASQPSLPKRRRAPAAKKAPHPILRPDLDDQDWFRFLGTLSQFAHADIGAEYGRCRAWCRNKGVGHVSRRRFLNWLGKVEKPLTAPQPQVAKRNSADDFYAEIERRVGGLKA